jgi:hypothetical protein
MSREREKRGIEKRKKKVFLYFFRFQLDLAHNNFCYFFLPFCSFLMQWVCNLSNFLMVKMFLKLAITTIKKLLLLFAHFSCFYVAIIIIANSTLFITTLPATLSQ